MATELTHASHHPSHCLAPGLFRSVRKGQRKREKLDVSYNWAGYRIRFVGFEPLGATDLRLLQGIVALAGPMGVILTPTPTLAIPLELRRGLAMAHAGKQMDALMLSCRAGKLLEETGMTDGGGNFRILIASLVRMSSVTAVVTRDAEVASYKLLSFSFDGRSKQLNIALNPLLSQAVCGEGPFTRIDMREVRLLRSDSARFIHQRLCGFLNQGRSTKVGLDLLGSYAWGDTDASPATARKRRQRILEALHEIAGCGWKVNEYRRNFFQISRPCGGSAVRRSGQEP